MTLRIAHFSDIHLTSRRLGWEARDLVSKRVTGWFNVKMLGRGKHFRHAPAVVLALVEELRHRTFDALAFSGDATGMGFSSEFAIASEALAVADPTWPPAVAVPGNHDYYTRRAVRHHQFENHFAHWQVGERIDDHRYPFARRVGDLWLVAVNSSTVNRGLLDASGEIGSDQLARLKKLCDRLEAGRRILVTHYPLRNSRGLVEHRAHRLRDHVAALKTAIDCKVSLWLHGHIHRPFVLSKSSQIPFPIACVGSSTMNDHWAYHDYSITPTHVEGIRRAFDQPTGKFRVESTFSLEMPGG